jgi:squalene-hopene/tetraprenyl-beta-curcumene cyclase
MTEPYIVRAATWLASVQHEDGGWGEGCETYADPSLKGRGASTPSQTAWAIMGLLACGRVDDPAVTRGVEHLLATQRPDGTWSETACTGTGFPQVYYLTYGLYRDYFPLMALGIYQRVRSHARLAAVPGALHP